MNISLGMEANGLVVILDKFGINIPLLSIQIVNFLLMAYLLYRFAFRDVIKSMDKRNKQIQDGLKYSEEMKKELSNIENNRNTILASANTEASSILNNAHKSAADLLQKQKLESKELAKDILDKAHLDIKNEHDAMLNELKNELKDVIVQATSRVLSHKLSDKERAQYRAQAIEILTEKTI